MAHRTAKLVGTAAAALAVVGTVLAISAVGEETSHPAEEAVSDLRAVTDFSLKAEGHKCAYDEDRGGLVYEGLTVASRSSGRLDMSFYVQRDSLDDVMPGYVSTVLVFDKGSPSHTFDVVVPVSQEDYEAGYDECFWSTGSD